MNSPARWHLLSTRPLSLSAPLSNAVAQAGGQLMPLDALDIETRLGDDTLTRLLYALRKPLVLFTSPTAVNVAAEVLDLAGALNRKTVIATGAGTQKTLVNRGVRQTRAPDRMDSEGLLAMPELTDVDGQEIGLVTGVGGRGVLQPTLEARGAVVTRADIYARVPREITASEWRAVCEAVGPRVLALTSAEAFENVLRWVPQEARFEDWLIVAASERLAKMASNIEASQLPRYPQTAAFSNRVVLAHSPMPEDLVAAALTALRA